MKIDLGNFLLALAWLMSTYGFIAGVYGASRKREAASASAANAVVLMGIFSLLSLAALGVAFLSGDYRYEYVWQNSNNAMYAPYRISAIWGGMAGSMLLWATFMALFAMVVVWRSAKVPVLLMRWVVPVLAVATNFFLAVTLFLTNPFKLIPTAHIPTDGSGLNPLLQNPSMLIHPPFLYLGFTGFSVPFAFCMGALLSRQLSDNWIRLTRLSTLIAWGFLTVGIILGGHWAYIELGWGGFWGWDPVENASFLPWLTGTAFLHSVMVQQRRGMLKVWNASLAILTYALTVLGTFITRSGVVQSVHAFSNSDVGWVFLVYLAVLIVVSVVLIAWRWKDLRPEHQFESFFSRETAFLFNNLVLLAICFATAWGVLFPLVSEALSGEKSVVGPPFFNRVNVPLFIALMFLMGAGPLIAWRKASLGSLWRTFRVPFFSGSIITAIFLILDSTRVYAAVSFGLALFVIAPIEAEFRRAAKARSVITS
ncbi:MAG: cytochrome c biogenesis protein CcsA, partial [bacterium]|nr:cytochrome c biogenesis protein CcsA [bacterium]